MLNIKVQNVHTSCILMVSWSSMLLRQCARNVIIWNFHVNSRDEREVHLPCVRRAMFTRREAPSVPGAGARRLRRLYRRSAPQPPWSPSSSTSLKRISSITHHCRYREGGSGLYFTPSPIPDVFIRTCTPPPPTPGWVSYFSVGFS